MMPCAEKRRRECASNRAPSTWITLMFAIGVVASAPSGAHALQVADARSFAELRIDMPDFDGYEVEYTSQGGRFFHQVRKYQMEGADKVNILNIIHMSNGVIVDSRGMDRSTLELEYMMTPYFAWGQEYVVAQYQGRQYDWVRVPIGGGEPARLVGASEQGPVVDDLGFSPVFASLLPLPHGARFSIPHAQPTREGTIRSALVSYEVVGQERLELESGLSCECWVLEQTSNAGGVTRFWVSRDAPFVFRRHRDIGGSRDFVSDALSFRSLR